MNNSVETSLICLLIRYIASPDKKSNNNYLGPAPLEDIAK